MWLSSEANWNSLTREAMTMAVVVRLIPAWQLKTMGVEAEVFLRRAVI